MSERVVGVDCCRGGWVALEYEDGVFTRALRSTTIEEIADHFRDAAVIAIDIPLGLLARGKRLAETETRTFLGSARNTVFWTPPLRAVFAKSQAQATVIAHELDGPGASAQFWALRDRVIEARSIWLQQQNRIFEIHPEASFVTMTGTTFDRKSTWSGLAQRLGALRAVGYEPPAHLGIDPAKLGADDVLDAAAAAWTADRIRRDRALRMPNPPEDDADGGPAAIWR